MEKYDPPVFEVIEFDAEDVIITSSCTVQDQGETGHEGVGSSGSG